MWVKVFLVAMTNSTEESRERICYGLPWQIRFWNSSLFHWKLRWPRNHLIYLFYDHVAHHLNFLTCSQGLVVADPTHGHRSWTRIHRLQSFPSQWTSNKSAVQPPDQDRRGKGRWLCRCGGYCWESLLLPLLEVQECEWRKSFLLCVS